MPVFIRPYANFARAISGPTADGSARDFTRREPGSSDSREPGSSGSGESRSSGSGQSCRAGTAGKPASRATCCPGGGYYRYIKSRGWR
jgi:hypothetical protein